MDFSDSNNYNNNNETYKKIATIIERLLSSSEQLLQREITMLMLLYYGWRLQCVCCNRRYRAGKRTCKVESSLKKSKTQRLKQLLVQDNVNVDEAVADILRIKSVSAQSHSQFGPTLKVCLSQITGYRQLISEVDSMRRIAYSSDNKQHETMLLQLWKWLKPGVELQSRISKQWTEIGFQGDDPMTDFRGMGMLGLQNLKYFVEHHTELAQQMVSRSHHPQYGYSFAIVSINITDLQFTLLNQGHLKTHFYNTVAGRPTLLHYHQLFCYLLYEFDKFWFDEKPRDIMEFNRIKSKFQKRIVHQMKDKNAILHCELNNQVASRPI